MAGLLAVAVQENLACSEAVTAAADAAVAAAKALRPDRAGAEDDRQWSGGSGGGSGGSSRRDSAVGNSPLLEGGDAIFIFKKAEMLFYALYISIYYIVYRLF